MFRFYSSLRLLVGVSLMLCAMGCVADQAQLRYQNPLGDLTLGGTFVDAKVDEGLQSQQQNLGKTTVCKAMGESASPKIRLFEGGVYYECLFGANWEKSCKALGHYKGNRLTIEKPDQSLWHFAIFAENARRLKVRRAFVGDVEVDVSALLPNVEESFLVTVATEDLLMIDTVLKSCDSPL